MYISGIGTKLFIGKEFLFLEQKRIVVVLVWV